MENLDGRGRDARVVFLHCLRGVFVSHLTLGGDEVHVSWSADVNYKLDFML